MNDLISRQAAIDAIKLTSSPYLTELNETYQAQVKVLKELPTAQQWIPCSERMPENDFTDVLVCVHDKRKGCENDFYVIQAYTVGKHWEPTLHVDMTDFDVVAWMPLPERYKEVNN